MKKNVIKQSILLTVALTIALQPAAIAATDSASNTNLLTKLLVTVTKWVVPTTLTSPVKPQQPPIKPAPPRPVEKKSAIQQVYTGITGTAYKGFTMVKNHPWYTLAATSVLAAIGLEWYVHKIFRDINAREEKDRKEADEQKKLKKQEEQINTIMGEGTYPTSEEVFAGMEKNLAKQQIKVSVQNAINKLTEKQLADTNSLNVSNPQNLGSSQIKSKQPMQQPSIQPTCEYEQYSDDATSPNGAENAVDDTIQHQDFEQLEKDDKKLTEKHPQPEGINSLNVINFGQSETSEQLKQQKIEKEEQVNLNPAEETTMLNFANLSTVSEDIKLLVEQKKLLKNENNNLISKTNSSATVPDLTHQPHVEYEINDINDPLTDSTDYVVTHPDLSNFGNEQIEESLNKSQPIYENLDLIKIEKQVESVHKKPLPQVPVKKNDQEKLNEKLLDSIAAGDTAAITNLIKAGAAKDLMVTDVTDKKNGKISAIYCAGTIPAIYCLVKNGYAIPSVNADLAEDADFALLREFTQKDMTTFVKDSLSGEQDEEFMADWTKILDLLVWQDVTKVDEFFTALQKTNLDQSLLQAPAKQWLYLKLLQTCMEGCPNDAAQQKYWEDQCSKQEFIKDEEFKGMLEATTNKVYILEANNENDVKNLEEANLSALAEKIKEPLKKIKKALKDLETSLNRETEEECCKTIWSNIGAMGAELTTADNIGENVEELKKRLCLGKSILGSTMLRQSALRNSILKNSIIKPNLTATIFLHPEKKTKNKTVQQFASMIYDKILMRMNAIMQKKGLELKNNPLAQNIRKLKTVAPNKKVDWKQAAAQPLMEVANKFDAVEDEEDLGSSSIIDVAPKNLEIKEKIVEKPLAERIVTKPVNTTTSTNLNKPAVKISPLLQKIIAVYEKKPQAPTKHELTLEKEKNFQTKNPQFVNTKNENRFEGESLKDQGRKDEKFEELKINSKLNPLGTLREAMEQLAARNHNNNNDEETDVYSDSESDDDGEDKKINEITSSIFEKKIKLKKKTPIISQALLNMQLNFGATAGQLYQINKKTK